MATKFDTDSMLNRTIPTPAHVRASRSGLTTAQLDRLTNEVERLERNGSPEFAARQIDRLLASAISPLFVKGI